MIDFNQNSIEYDPENIFLIEEKLFLDGFVQIQFSFDSTTSIESLERFFIEFIEKLGGKCLKHNEDKDSIVWHVRPMEKSTESDDEQRQRARSQTDDEFPFHTDCSYETNPPEFMSLFVIEEDQCDGGHLEIIRLDDVLKLLSDEIRQNLLEENFRISIPKEFRQSANVDHIDGPILLDEKRIRFRYDILSNGNQKILDEFNEKLQLVERHRPKLRKFSMILLNNQRYLHGRTKVLDKNRHLLRIRFDRPLSFDVFSIYDRKYLRSDVLRFQNDFSDFLHEKHRELCSILHLIVEQYDKETSIGEEIRKTFEFDDKIDRLIRISNRCRPHFRLGLYRPDFVLTSGEKFRFNGKEYFQPKFCEINARFPFNGFLLSAGICLKTYPNLIEQIVDEIQFDRTKSISILKSKEFGFDINLFSQFWRNKYQQNCDFVLPKHLKISNGNLIDRTNGKLLEQIIFELHQDEIVEIDDEILQFCIENDRIKFINDFRTIFLLHDKRLFSLLSNSSFLYGLTGRFPSTSFNEIFPRTWTIDRIPKFLRQTILNDRHHWLIKPNSLGKGEQILIGFETSFEQWKTSIDDKNHRQWIVQQYFPSIEFDSMKMSGFFLCLNDRCFPLGIIRLSKSNVVNISHGGAFIRCIFPPEYQHRSKMGSILTKAELDEQLIERKSVDPQWNKNVYLSVSGGSGGKQLCFLTDIRENQRQREIFVEMLLKEEILDDRDVCLNIFHSNRIYRSMEIFNDFCSIANATSVPVGADVDDEFLLETIERYRPNVLMGMPYRLVKFARFLQSKNENKVSFEKIFFAGEVFDAAKRTYCSTAFNCSIFLGFYGSAETGVFACQTKSLSSTRFYLFPKELVDIEIIDEEILVTNRIRRRNQLIRFNTGDRGRILPFSRDDRYGLIELFQSQRIFIIEKFPLSKNDVETIVEPLNFLEWQMIIESIEDQTNRNRFLFRFCQSKQNFSIEQIQDEILSNFEKLFKNKFLNFLRHVEIEFESIEMKDFIRNETSNKLLKIVDRRKS